MKNLNGIELIYSNGFNFRTKPSSRTDIRWLSTDKKLTWAFLILFCDRLQNFVLIPKIFIIIIVTIIIILYVEYDLKNFFSREFV